MARPMVEVGIVLHRGCALGAYECGALNALRELMDELKSQGCPIVLKAISGVSIGAINGAYVVGSADTLARHIDFAALNRSTTTYVVTAVDVESGELKRFSNHALGPDPRIEIEPKRIQASGSLPLQFRPDQRPGHDHRDARDAGADGARRRPDRRVDREFKVIRFVDIEMQGSSARPGPQSPSDDQDGLRDFSPVVVRERREAGHDIARRRLLPVFKGCGLVSTKEIRRRPAAPARS